MIYDTLVLAGGSTKGIVTLGSLQFLYDKNIFSKTDKYIGTSSGAMICYLLVIGYSPIEIFVHMCVHKLTDKLKNFCIFSFSAGKGALSFDPITKYLEQMTIEKLGYIPTFSDIKEKLGKTFICAVHNVDLKQTEYMGPDTSPDMICITGIRMSASLPMIFEEYKYNDNMYIDGGMSDNFPLKLGDELGTRVLGIMVEDDGESFVTNHMLKKLYKYLFIPIYQGVKYKISQCSNKTQHVILKYDGSNFNFDISTSEKFGMFSTGYQQMTAWYPQLVDTYLQLHDNVDHNLSL